MSEQARQNSLAYIQSHYQDSAADIAAALAADPRFLKRIYADDLNGWFGARGQITKFKLKRALQDSNLLSNGQAIPLLAGIDLLLDTAALGKQVGWLSTDEAEAASQIRAFSDTIVALGILSQEERDGLLSLAGGPYYEPLTEQEVQDELDRIQADLAKQDLLNRVEAGARACRDLLSAGNPTVLELQAAFAEALDA